MSYIEKLRAEIAADPEGLGYAGKSHAAVADLLNAVNRTVRRASMNGDEVFAVTYTEPGRFDALTDAQKAQWLAFCGRAEIDPFSPANEIFVIGLFGPAGSPTVQALAAARVMPASRATELGFPTVLPGHVEMARA